MFGPRSSSSVGSWSSWSWLIVVAGCSFSGGQSPNRDAAIVADAAPDAYIPDSGLCPAAGSVECVGGEVLRTCAASAPEATDKTCYWGCVPSGSPHCGAVMPTAGGVVIDQDLADNSALDTVTIPAAGATFNVDTGQITGGVVRPATPNGGTSAGINYQKRLGDKAAIFQFANVFVDGPITFVGSRAVAIVATGRIRINAAVDVQGPCLASAAGPGGHPGGNANLAAVGAGGGASGGNALDSGGGGGGGHGGIGGGGGGPSTPPVDAGVDAPPDASLATAIATGGPAFGIPTIAALEGGGGGGGGGGTAGGRGGGGGGAIQFVANIEIDITRTGSIDASGCGGLGGTSALAGGGGGGGAGGTVVLEAARVILDGSLAVNGGGGGGGGLGQPGANGALGRTGASGGTGTPGGVGGAGATATGGLGQTDLVNAGGGGGGAVGRMRFNVAPTRTVTLILPVLSPALDDPASTTTQGTATVR